MKQEHDALAQAFVDHLCDDLPKGTCAPDYVAMGNALLHAHNEIKALREAVRKHGMVQRHRLAYGGTTVHVGWRCNVCEAEWECGEKEIHFPDCPVPDERNDAARR